MKYIVIEGVDGSGKTTICKALKEEFEHVGFKCAVIHEPGFCDKRYRDLIMDPLTPDISRLFLFLADRQRTKIYIETKLNDYDVVISDRSFLSTLVYQGKIFGMSKTKKLLEDWDLIPKYDLAIILDINKQTFKTRCNYENTLDNFCDEFFDDVRHRYLELTMELENAYIVNAENDIYDILKEILGLCCYKKLFPNAKFC